MLRRGPESLVGAREPLVQLGEVHRVIHRVHARGVGHGFKLLGHVATHALGVRLGRDELGVRRLQGEQLLEEPVERGIGHLGVVERVVGVGGMGEDAIELRMPDAWGARGRGFRRGIVVEERHLGLRILLICHVISPTCVAVHPGPPW